MPRHLHNAWIPSLAWFSGMLLLGCAIATADESNLTSQRIKVTKLDDLPQHTYPISGRVLELVDSDEQIRKLSEKVRADIQADLNAYEISDVNTLQKMYTTLQHIDLLEGNYNAAILRIEQIRALESKEAKRLTAGLVTKAMATARRAVGPDAGEAQYKKAFRSHFGQRVAKLPWDVVQDAIERNKGRMEIVSKNLLTGIIQARMEPAVEQTGELSAEQAAGVLSMYVTIRDRLPLKNEIVSVYQQLIDANRTTKTDIWQARSVSLSTDRDLTPVLVGVWDSGTDTDVFKDRLFVNPKEHLDGKDTDNNGYVDDLHGIAYDIHARRTTGMLCPLGDAADRISQVMKHLKGFTDLMSSVNSPDASAIKQHLAGLERDAVKGFLEDLSLAANHSHGTHVAGIIAEGNPFTRILIARLSYDHRMKPVARTVTWGGRDAAKCLDTVEYFKTHGVRVVNMSWGEAQKDVEESLQANGIGDSAAERREIARKVFALQKDGLYKAIKNAPDILFLAAAGNADNDVEFDDDIPSSFDLPNLLVVGAVDQAGDPTTFTSFGKTVQVYANGFEVDSYIPGGERMKMSGTSMASPNAANLAAKLLAINPKLTPPAVVQLIKKGADTKTVGTTTFLLMNPRNSVKLLHTTD